MYRWIESMRVENGQVQNLAWHQKRVDNTFNSFAPDIAPLSLYFILAEVNLPHEGVFKLRLVYDLERIIDLQISNYTIQYISKFYLVDESEISYSFKFEDRACLDNLDHLEAEPIILQQELVTDTRYSNLIFRNDEGWFTPTSYLLNGTMRQKLLADGDVKECMIGINDLQHYTHFKMINAMMPLKDAILYDINLIKF